MKTTVICAAWHGEPNLHSLLGGFDINLERQTTPHKRIYVLDNTHLAVSPEDTPDNQKVIAVSKPLTIYQAWNVALSLVDTPYVMNLNLDDRLAPDAIEIMEMVIESENSFLVGGDWRICHSQESTDAVSAKCLPVENVPVCKNWPPKISDLNARIGSGDGTRATFGPATMWRMDAHSRAKCPRYPFRFYDGELIKIVGDSAWWSTLLYREMKMSRIPSIIGNYHSHPTNQAEFRSNVKAEMEKLSTVGIQL